MSLEVPLRDEMLVVISIPARIQLVERRAIMFIIHDVGVPGQFAHRVDSDCNREDRRCDSTTLALVAAFAVVVPIEVRD